MDQKDLKRFLLDKTDEGYCLVVGTNEMMDNFTSAFGVSIEIIMMDYQKVEGEIESKPMEIFNGRKKEIQLLGMAKKIDLIDARRMLNMPPSTEEDDMVAIELIQEIDEEYGYKYSIEALAAKTDQEKVDIVDSIFREPETINDQLRKEVKDAIRRNDAYIYLKK